VDTLLRGQYRTRINWLAARAEAVINGEWISLTETVLVSHLLLEQALVERIRQKFARPMR
jgi:hypothetical protein